MRKSLLSLILMVLFVIGTYVPVYGEQVSNSINVTLPSFKVTLNGIEVNNKESKYPLIVYKDITYFPMTYNDCRFLGIESYWNGNEDGLSIEATGVTAAYKPYIIPTKNSGKYRAAIPEFPIKVNGKIVDNSKEMYPLLSFRDITYFPMTWKYSVNEFGWDYSFNNKDGLVINSDNIKLEQVALSKDRAKNEDGTLKNNVIVNGKFIYYEGSKGRIMQASLSDASRIKTVYQLPIWTYGDGKTYVNPYLYMEDREAVLFYHQGGATMGTEYLIQLKDDGTTTVLNDTRYALKNIADKSFKYWIGPAPGPNNL